MAIRLFVIGLGLGTKNKAERHKIWTFYDIPLLWVNER